MSGTELSFLYLYLFGNAARMPPLPAPELNEWELNTIRRWMDNGTPP